MPDARSARDYIGEFARHQNCEGPSVDVYAGLSEEDRIALMRMLTDGDHHEAKRWVLPPEEL
jgi:hypothetical protein